MTNPPAASGVTVKIAVSADQPLPAPEGANYFHMTYAAEEVQLLIGAVNLLQVHEAKSRGEVVTLVPEITHRFILSRFAFQQLAVRINELAQIVPQVTGAIITTVPAKK